MDLIISPDFFINDILTKLFNNELEPTADNINYVCNLTSSINYGLIDLSDDQIDFWVSLLWYTRQFLLRSSRDILLFNMPAIVELVFITIQIEQVCVRWNKKIPNLIHLLEGKVEIKKPEKIIEFPIVPITQIDGLSTNEIKCLDLFKSVHKFELPTLDAIIHYSLIVSMIYCNQFHQPDIDSILEFKKRTKYVFKFPTDFVYNVSAMPPIDDPLTFILVRSFFEELNDVHLDRPFVNENAFYDVIEILLSSKEDIDESKFFSTFVYIESKSIPFPMQLCDSRFSSILLLAIFEIEFTSEISCVKGSAFKLTPNFLMMNKLAPFFASNLKFASLIDTQMKSLFSKAKFIINSVDTKAIDILTESQKHSLPERLHALGSLAVYELREDVYPTVLSFWCTYASNLISELKTVKVTSEYINGLIGVCRVAVIFSKKNEFTPINCILNQEKKGEYKGEIPSYFPTYIYTTPSDELSFCDSVNINFELIDDVLRYLLLIAMRENNMKPNEFIMKLNDDYYGKDKHELKDPLLFIALRYLYEKTFNIEVKREYGNTTVFLEVLKTGNVNPLVYYQGIQIAMLTKQTFENRKLYFALWACGAFTNKDLMSICNDVVENGLKLFSYVKTRLNTELENLVERAFYDDKEAAKQLLKHKECLPLLKEKKSPYHLLLKIFLSDEEPTINPEIDIDDSIEISAKLFACTKIKKAPSTDILIAIVKQCYFYFFEDALSPDSDKNLYLYNCGVLVENKITIYEKEEEFFISPTIEDFEGSVNFANTVLYYALLFLKDQDHPELIKYYTDFAKHGLLSPKIKEILPKPNEKRSLYWLLSTCTLSYNRSSDLDLILEKMDVKLIKQLYQYILLNRDANCLIDILQNKRACPNISETIGYDYLSLSLEMFFNTNSNKEIGKIVKILINEDYNFLIHFICSHILENPDYSMVLFNKLKIEKNDAIEFIKNLPKFEKPIPSEAIPFFESILSTLSRTFLRPSILKQKTEDKASIELKWKEDIVEQKEGSIDIWKEKQYLQCEGNNDNKPHCAFCCYSCSMSDSFICTACAATCHKDHRVSYIKQSKFKCSCENNGTCIFGNQNLNQNDSVEKLVHPPTNKLIDLMIAISNIKEDNDEETSEQNKNQLSFSAKKITSRLTKPILTLCTRNYDLNCALPRFCFVEKKKKLINIDLLKDQYKGHNQQLFKKRCSYVPLNLSDYDNGHIIFACGKTIVLIDEATNEIEHLIILNEEVMSVKVSTVNSEMVVLTSLRSVNIVKSSNLNQIFTINPSNIDDNNYIIQAEMPIKDKVCVVRRQCVELYQIGNNNPIETFTVNNDFITSSVFVNYHDRPFGIFAHNTGRIALQVLGEGESGRFNHYSSIPSRYVSIFISYCKENGLFFIAAPGASLQYTPIENIFKYDGGTTHQLRNDSGIRSEICFHCTYPGIPSILIFVNPAYNSIFALEFTDEGPEISALIIDNENEIDNNESSEQRPLSIFDSRLTFLSVLRTSTDIIAFSSNGSLLQMEKLIFEINPFEYRVPPSFYTSCEIATTENAEIIGTDSTQNYNTLFHDSVAYFHVTVKRKIMTLLLKDPTYSIVGFVLSFDGSGPSHRPAFISVYGRRYNCLNDYSISVPLMPNEVNPGKPLDIEFANTATYEIAMQGIKIFIIKSDKILPFLKTIKMSENENKELQKNLLDFQDDFNESKNSIVDNLMYKAATAINFENDDNDKSSIVEMNSFALLIRMMYTNKKVEKFARSAVVRIIKSNKNMEIDLLKIWAKELLYLLNEKLIDDQIWEFVWRDYMLFPDQIKQIIKDVIWSPKAKIGSAESIFSVFTL